MQHGAQEQSQQVNALAYPQFCGSWPDDEWPENALRDRRGAFIDLCAGPYVENISEIGAQVGLEGAVLKSQGRSI